PTPPPPETWTPKPALSSPQISRDLPATTATFPDRPPPHATGEPKNRGFRHQFGVVANAKSAGFDGLEGVLERLDQDSLADGADHEAEQSAPEVLTLADHDDVNVGRPVGLRRERVRVTRAAAPQVGVGR